MHANIIINILLSTCSQRRVCCDLTKICEEPEFEFQTKILSFFISLVLDLKLKGDFNLTILARNGCATCEIQKWNGPVPAVSGLLKILKSMCEQHWCRFQNLQRSAVKHDFLWVQTFFCEMVQNIIYLSIIDQIHRRFELRTSTLLMSRSNQLN